MNDKSQWNGIVILRFKRCILKRLFLAVNKHSTLFMCCGRSFGGAESVESFGGVTAVAESDRRKGKSHLWVRLYV